MPFCLFRKMYARYEMLTCSHIMCHNSFLSGSPVYQIIPSPIFSVVKAQSCIKSFCTQNSHWLPTVLRHAGLTGSAPVKVILHCTSLCPYSQPVHLPLQFPFTTNYGDRSAPFRGAGAAGEGKSRGQPLHKSQQAYWIKTQNKEAY